MADHIEMWNILVVATKTFTLAAVVANEEKDQNMILEVALGSFYSRGDERRLFFGFKEISAIRSVKGIGPNLMIDIEVAALNKEAMREMLALLWRYEICLAPLRVFAEKKKFSWLNDEQGYWHSDMFQAA